MSPLVVNSWNNMCSRKGSWLKLKGLKNGNKILQDFVIETIKHLQHIGVEKQLATINEG
jgi:hypothetical protein